MLPERLNKKLKYIFLSGTIIVLCLNTFCFCLACPQSVEKQTFVTTVAFYVIKYIVPSFCNYICIFLVRKLNVILEIFTELSKINPISYRCDSKHIIVKLYVAVMLLGVVPLTTLEIVYKNSRCIDLWCGYVPSIVVGLYFAIKTLLIETCGLLIENINENMKRVCNEALKDKILKITTRPEGKTHMKNFYHNFYAYDKMHDILCRINDLGGVGVVVYYLIGITMCLSVTYTYITQPEKLYNGFLYKTNFSCEYCCLVFLLGTWLLTLVSHRLQNEAHRSGRIVHELINLDPSVTEEVILHGLQLLGQKTQITAAGLFTINFDIAPEIVLLFVTHLSVFIQIDEYYK